MSDGPAMMGLYPYSVEDNSVFTGCIVEKRWRGNLETRYTYVFTIFKRFVYGNGF